MLRNIQIPTYITDGIDNKVRKFPKRIKFWGADFETVKGDPYTWQISPDGINVDFFWVNKNNVLKTVINYFQKNIIRNHTNVVYFHNLNFDLSVLLIKYHKDFLGRSGIRFNYSNDIEVEAVLSMTNFCKITFNDSKGSTVLMILDSLAFFSGGSLSSWAEKLNLPFKKLEKPCYLGERKLKSKKFIKYSSQDAIVQWHLAKWILDQHKKYNVAPCISAAQFAMRVFRSKFFEKRTHFPYIPSKALSGSILSYHGGRNGFYVDRPTIFKDCVELDISSAYPYAMANMPNFNHCKYVNVTKFHKDKEGIYEISGIYKGCKYPCIFDHNFKELKKGSAFRIWTTSYELKEAMKDNSIKRLKIIQGWLIKETNSYNPLKEYVEFFYNKKQNSSSSDERIMFKIFLNSLYGKFVQSTINDDEINDNPDNMNVGEIKILCNEDGTQEIISKPKESKIFTAGGMFNPLIATLITGFTRAYLHRLEHKYHAIHSSTDSIKCNFSRIDEKELKKGLGGLEIQVRGSCIVLRNKLYLHYNEKDELSKFALHGFCGDTKILTELIKNKKNTYSVKKMLRVRSALRQGLTPLVMMNQDKELKNVDLSNIQILTKY